MNSLELAKKRAKIEKSKSKRSKLEDLKVVVKIVQV